MLKTRIITAVLLLVPLIGAWWQGGWFFQTATWALCAIALWEWLKLLDMRSKAAAIWTLASGVLIWMGWLYAPPMYLKVWMPIVCLAWLLVLIATVLLNVGRNLLRRHGLFLAMIFCWSGWLALQQLMQHSRWTLVAVLLIVWLADIAAYVSGRMFGKHKLLPSISPGKTWEGVAGAMLANMVYTWSAPSLFADPAYWLTDTGWPLGLKLLLMVTLTAVAVLGDLFESMLKRMANVKDSGKILPGHGGVFDRIDALLPILPLAALLLP